MTNSSVGTLMYKGVRSFGWIFWYWHRIKQRIGKGYTMRIIDKLYYKVVITAFKSMEWYKYEMAKSQ